MAKGRRFTTRPAPPQKPADAAAAGPQLRKFMLKLFDREDGRAADWPLLAETLLAEAFYALDQVPDDPRVLTLLHWVHAGSYDRLTGNPPENHTSLCRAGNAAVAGFNLKSPGPGEAPT